MKYYYCSKCGPDKTERLLPCMKLVVGCDKELTCPKCEEHLDQNLITESFTEFKNALKKIT